MKSYNRGLTRPEINNIFFLEIRIPPADTFQMTITMVEMVHYMHNQIFTFFQSSNKFSMGLTFGLHIFFVGLLILLFGLLILLFGLLISQGHFTLCIHHFSIKWTRSIFINLFFFCTKNFEPIIAHKSFLSSLCAPFLLQ